ncbi:insulinase family protein [Nostoc sp. FACHB-152]|uniref:M16 family metallopeptidase n=1 Tax=unclassified Nostoc TaxID=2593658 RepID=UPI001686E020|nr:MULTISPECIES: pitrilysin family protein [unclassified Nostoc]MBD2448744.1 insulinase family protein [Nostoc sp. FACHB-152]MBD2470169.1 insulinase family protein [Nostoc sp. FACHB-145]
MSVFFIGYGYRWSLLFLSLWIITVSCLSDQPANSKYTASLNQKNIQTKLIANHPNHSKITEKVRKTVLENGLTVLTKEVHTAPVVSVQMWYKVGSRNEEPGVNGIAHQLEHMMFKGTKNRPVQFGRLFSALGSDSNAFTSYDQTAYYGTVESDKLKALLVLEADRMQNSLINAEQLASEKRVVISELQGYENSPEYRLNRAVMRSLFPNHAYGLPVGGTKADVENFQVEQVQKYYRDFYTPDNAVLVIVGDFQTTKTLETVKELFGKLPNSKQVTVNSKQPVHPTPHSPLPTPLVIREPGAAAMYQVVYPLPDLNHPDIPALEVMDYILTEGRNSRLYQALVESGLASEVSASVASLRDAGWYELLVTADDHQDLKKIETVLQRAIANLAQKGVKPEEIARAKTQLEAATILSNRDITSQAMQLGNDEITAGDYRYTNRYLDAVRQVTAADIVKVVNKYLKPEARVVGLFQPTNKNVAEIGNKPDFKQTTENLSASTDVVPADVGQYLPPLDETKDVVKQVSHSGNHYTSSPALPQQFTLSNGLQVLLLPDKSTPTITLSGNIKAGKEFDLENQAGLASFVADNLMSGTKTKNALTLAKALEERGASLDFSAYREGVRIEGDSLAGDLPILIQTLADAVKNSTFPKKELELSRQQTLTDLKQELDDPAEVAKRVFVQSIYPKQHPLHAFPTEKSLQKIRREDVIAFKAKYYRPDTTVLVLVGDFEPAKVRSLLQTELGDWEVSGQPPQLKYPVVAMPNDVVSVNSVIPGKAQAITFMGYTGITRQDPRYYAALVLNQILGGDTLSSYLGAEVRDRQGLTYGIYSYLHAQKNVGTFWIEMQTSPEDSNKAIASTRKLLQEIHQQGVTLNDVETAKNTLISNYKVSLANPEELVNQILMNQVYGLEITELHSFTEKIKNVTLAEVNQAARELLNPDRIVVVTAGPSVVADKNIR